MAKKQETSKGKIVFFSIVSFIVGFLASYLVVAPTLLEPTEPINATDLEINIMMVGNKFNGDTIYIKAGDTDILVDAGSRKGSAETIKNYIFDNQSNHAYVSDGKLEYVIATHADQDHIAGFVGSNDHPGIFKDESIEIETVIQFSRSDRTSDVYYEYCDAVNELKANGTKVYTALECYNNINGAQRVIQVAEGIEIEILYNHFYENKASDENDYSVCFMLRRGTQQFLFTGDLEGEGEKYLVINNDLGKVYFYKVGHHGSYSSSTQQLLGIIQPKLVVASCTAFYNEYRANEENIFPAQASVSRLAQVGTVEQFYVTQMASDNSNGYVPANGNVVIKSNDNGTSVECSESNTNFFEFEIFKKYRIWG